MVHALVNTFFDYCEKSFSPFGSLPRKAVALRAPFRYNDFKCAALSGTMRKSHMQRGFTYEH